MRGVVRDVSSAGVGVEKSRERGIPVLVVRLHKWHVENGDGMLLQLRGFWVGENVLGCYLSSLSLQGFFIALSLSSKA